MRTFACVLLAGWLTSVAWSEPQIKIFSLANRPVSATIDLVRSLLGPGESVWPEERLQRLIVKAEPARLAEIEKLLQDIDVAAPQVWLKVVQVGSRPYAAGGAGVALGPDGRIRGGAQQTSVQHNVSSSQMLLVMSGERGSITVGEDIPVVQPFWQFVHGLGLLPPGVIFQRVSTGFAVEPTVIGSNIRVKVIPWLSYQSPQGNGRVEFAEAATSVSLKDGETLTISQGSGSQSSQSSAFGLILGNGYVEQASGNSIVLTADIKME